MPLRGPSASCSTAKSRWSPRSLLADAADIGSLQFSGLTGDCAAGPCLVTIPGLSAGLIHPRRGPGMEPTGLVLPVLERFNRGG